VIPGNDQTCHARPNQWIEERGRAGRPSVPDANWRGALGAGGIAGIALALVACYLRIGADGAGQGFAGIIRRLTRSNDSFRSDALLHNGVNQAATNT
jgi:hypothetical protein